MVNRSSNSLLQHVRATPTSRPNRFGPRPVGELCLQLGLTAYKVSKHLRILRDAELLEMETQGQQHVSRLAVLIGVRLDLPDERLDVIRWAGLLHDIGKIGIKDDVLLKPDELTPEEWTSIRQHPIIAAEILAPIHGATEIASIVLAHHESPDGSGYPKALKGYEIPVEAQIVRVADVFASLVEVRPYKPARSVQEALTILRSMAGTKVDARASRALERLVTGGAPVL